jgi:hypothetical protein
MHKIIALAAGVLWATSTVASAQLQFDSNGPVKPAPMAQSAPDSLAWLAKKPATMMDLGLQALSHAAEKSAARLFDVGAVIAEYHPDQRKLTLSYAGQTPYSEENCAFVVTKLRDMMFPVRDDVAGMTQNLLLYFSSASDSGADMPADLGAALVNGLFFVLYQPGGMCSISLLGDKPVFWKDPNYVPPTSPEVAPDPKKGKK